MLDVIIAVFISSAFSIFVGFIIGRAVGYNEARIKNKIDDFLNSCSSEDGAIAWECTKLAENIAEQLKEGVKNE